MLRCLHIEQKSKGLNHIDTATPLHNIGLLYDDMEDYPNALKFYQNALQIKEAHTGKDTINCSSTLNNIGMVYWNMSQFDKALVYFTKCL